MSHAPKCYKPGCTKPCRPKTWNDGVAAEFNKFMHFYINSDR